MATVPGGSGDLSAWRYAPALHPQLWTKRAGHRPRFFKAATESTNFGILEDDRCIDTGVFQRRYLVQELVFACSPPPPPCLQNSHTILTEADWCAGRAVAWCGLGLLSHHYRGVGIPSVLALIGAYDAVLRCTLGTERRPLFSGLDLRRLKGRNTGVCVKVGLLDISLSTQQPFPSSPISGHGVCPGANHAMEKKELLDGRCIVPPQLQSLSAARQRTASRISRDTDPPRRGIQRGRQTKGSFTPDQACKGIFCADQTGFAYEELRRRIRDAVWAGFLSEQILEARLFRCHRDSYLHLSQLT